VPSLRFVAGYADEPAFVRLHCRFGAPLLAGVARCRRRASAADRLLISFHGVPRATLLAGDPYYCHCLKTARLSPTSSDCPTTTPMPTVSFSERRADPSKPDEVDFGISFQSRFGFAEWVRPYSDATLDEWGKAGVERVDVVAPAFSADCLETLEEITMQLAETFKHAGGKRLRYIPALNADDGAIAFYADLVLRNTLGWPEQQLLAADVVARVAAPHKPRSAQDAKRSCQRAIARATELNEAVRTADLARAQRASEATTTKQHDETMSGGGGESRRNR
jgi:ferrochelatase